MILTKQLVVHKNSHKDWGPTEEYDEWTEAAWGPTEEHDEWTEAAWGRTEGHDEWTDPRYLSGSACSKYRCKITPS